MRAWLQLMEQNMFKHLPSLKRIFPSADYAKPYTIFNVGGTKYRVVAIIDYNLGKLLIEGVFTHEQYNRWSPGI